MNWRNGRTLTVLYWCLAALAVGVVAWWTADAVLAQRASNQGPAVSWPFSSPFFWTMCGGLAPLLVVAVIQCRTAWRKSHARKLAAAAKVLGLQHSFEPLPYFVRYRGFDILLTHTNLDSKLQNHLYGRFKSQPVDVVEYAYSVGKDEAIKNVRQTLVIFPAGKHRLPIFRMCPQNVPKLDRLLLGEPGTVFWKHEPDAKKEQVGQAKRSRHEFHDNYEMTCGYSLTQRRLVDISPNVPFPATEDASQLEAQLRQLFDESLLQFFTHEPGWHVESVGKYLAVWETGRFVRPSQLEDHLLSALEVADQLRGALPRPKTRADTTRRVETVTGVQQKTQRAINVISGLLGAAVGSITSGLTVAGAITLIQQRSPRYTIIIQAVPFVALAVVFGLLVGSVGGLVIGARVIGPAIRSFRRHTDTKW